MADISIKNDLEPMLKKNRDEYVSEFNSKGYSKENTEKNKSSSNTSKQNKNLEEDNKTAGSIMSVVRVGVYLILSALVSILGCIILDRTINYFFNITVVESNVFKFFVLVFDGFGIGKIISEFNESIKKIKEKKVPIKLLNLILFMVLLSCFCYTFTDLYSWANDEFDKVFNVNEQIEVESSADNFNQNMTFKIDNLDYSLEMSDDFKSKCMFDGYTESEIRAYINDLYNKEEKNSKRKFPYSIQRQENDFMKYVRNPEKVPVVTAEIVAKLPEEKELLEVIDAEYDYAKEKMNYFYSERLSNLYQKLALEYYKQDSSKLTVMYYYLKSVEFDLISVSCASDENDYNSAIKRIRKRYQDINMCCDSILTESEKQQLIYLYDVFGKLYK